VISISISVRKSASVFACACVCVCVACAWTCRYTNQCCHVADERVSLYSMSWSQYLAQETVSRGFPMRVSSNRPNLERWRCKTAILYARARARVCACVRECVWKIACVWSLMRVNWRTRPLMKRRIYIRCVFIELKRSIDREACERVRWFVQLMRRGFVNAAYNYCRAIRQKCGKPLSKLPQWIMCRVMCDV